MSRRGLSGRAGSTWQIKLVCRRTRSTFGGPACALKAPHCAPVGICFPKKKPSWPQAYRFAKDRLEFIATRALLRQTLARYVNRSATDLCFDSNQSGKPLLREAHGLHFSVSHCRGFAVLAFARNPVGIDVEYIRSAVLRESVIEQCLSARERFRHRRLPFDRRTAALFRCWTQKEALLKALGSGLLFPPQQIDVAECGAKAGVVNVVGRDWLICPLAAPPGYAAAAAIKEPNYRIKFRQWKLSVNTFAGHRGPPFCLLAACIGRQGPLPAGF